MIAGVEQPDEGEVVTVSGDGVGHLGQILDLPGHHTVQQAVDAALAELRAMERRMRELEADLATDGPDGCEARCEDRCEDRCGARLAGHDRLLTEYGDLLSVYEARGGYEADARIDKAMHGLGLAHIGRDRRLGSLSGGEQARLGLACLLAAAPEVMLLDEPTNHLDEAATTWLEERLRAHRGTVVAVSHDRVFLDRVATAILEVDNGAVTRFGGGYTGFLAEQAAARQRWEQAYADWVEEIRRVRAFAATTAHRVAHGRPMKDGNKMAYDRDAGRVQSSIAGRLRQAQERLRRLEEDPVPEPPEPLRFRGLFERGTADGPVAELHGVRVADRLAVDSFGIGQGRRLLVHGPNGAGKSTFLRVLAGELEPDRGSVRRRGRIGHLPQEITFTRPERTVLDTFAEGRPGDAEEHRASLTSLGLFRADTLHARVGTLSVGQCRRLALARLLTAEADLLLLDEPTNHLSLKLVEELEEALGAYRGALVVVSHDRATRSRFAGAQVEMRDGRLL
ncbi:macrolide transport system ATP-binding/permease protein [Streptosporangium becharense]|uniref:Macrolide transport system ATP-binding/permease protein n=1 Tax=Streptosporangium becharense TaxID=1816182 RepID=A0A7W9IHM9_9ACTN|nr:macrolide transport system ATP-binding/permease protein [Streptosporangium becharense]MBB5820756.1 macrolide transport system ATP-binding/permease protein [Streptosporangium becharense]